MSTRDRTVIAVCLTALACAMTGSARMLAQTKSASVPDLSGTWFSGTATPFERPAALGDKAFYSEAEALEQERQASERRATAQRARRPGDVGNDNEAFVDTGYKMTSTRQTSLIVDPADGRLPILPAAEKQREFNVNNLDSYEHLSPWDRCITRGPTALFPAGYNNGYQIVQTRDYVMILSEMIHEARIVPLDGRPHLNTNIKQWSGDSRGRWEGATLVVETTNFHDRGWVSTHASSGRLRGIPMSAALHIVERFTLVDAKTLSYQMTVEDPNEFARPWTFSMPFVRDDGYQIYEYACHEGNQATALMLRGARMLEKEAQTSTRP